MQSKDSCECERCQKACSIAPGWFLPGEAERVALFLGVSLEELFRTKLNIDWWLNEDGTGTFALSPGIKNTEAGTILTYKDRYGECVFFENGSCTIHPVRPHECAEVWHQTTESEGTKLHTYVASSWHSDEHRRQLTRLLGKEPKLPDDLYTSTFLFGEDIPGLC